VRGRRFPIGQPFAGLITIKNYRLVKAPILAHPGSPVVNSKTGDIQGLFFAQNVASELGLSLVVTKNEEYLLSFATSVDITTAVISRMQPHHQHASADHNHQHRSTDHTTEHARSADPSAPRPLPVQAAQESRPLQ